MSEELLDIFPESKTSKIKDLSAVLDKINTLAQVRRTIDKEGIDELKEAISSMGYLINPIVVALLDESQVREYLAVFNYVFRANTKLKDLKALNYNGGKYYIILIAGHRRLAAIKSILSENPEFKISLSANVLFNISPEEALNIQISENTHERVPTAAEAEAIAQVCFFHLKQAEKKGDKLSLKDLANKVSRSREVVSNALRFYELPESVKKLAFKREMKLPYGLFLEIASFAQFCREHGKNWSEDAMLREVLFVYLKGWNLPEIKKYFANKKEQIKMASKDFFLENDLGISDKELLQILDRELAMSIASLGSYINKIKSVIESLPDEDSRLLREKGLKSSFEELGKAARALRVLLEIIYDNPRLLYLAQQANLIEEAKMLLSTYSSLEK